MILIIIIPVTRDIRTKTITIIIIIPVTRDIHTIIIIIIIIIIPVTREIRTTTTTIIIIIIIIPVTRDIHTIIIIIIIIIIMTFPTIAYPCRQVNPRPSNYLTCLEVCGLRSDRCWFPWPALN